MSLKDFNDEFMTEKKQKVAHDEFDHFPLSPNIILAQESRIRWAYGTHGEGVDEGFWLGRLKKKAMLRHSYRLEAIYIACDCVD
jgi:hypothetical protein